MGDKPLCLIFSHLYHLFDIKLLWLRFVLPASTSSSSISLDFPLTNRETLEVSVLLLLLDVHASQERRDIRVWFPSPRVLL